MAQITFIGTGNYPVISASAHGLTNNQFVKLKGTTCVPVMDGVFTASNCQTNTFQITASSTISQTGSFGGFTSRIFFLKPCDYTSSIYPWEHNGGNNSNSGHHFTSSWQSLVYGPTSARTQAGDIIRVMASPYPTLVDSSSVFTFNTSSILLTSNDAIQIVDTCISTSAADPWSWRPSSGSVLTSQTTTRKNPISNIRITLPASPAANTKYAYKAFSQSLDLTKYTRLSCWTYISAAFASSSTYVLKLCSDYSGSNALATLIWPYAGGGNTNYPAILETPTPSASLPSGINSIAIYTGNTAPAASNLIQLNQIIACKTASSSDALTFASLIGKNTEAEPYWYPIRSFSTSSNTQLILELDSTWASIATSLVRQVFSTETASLYKRECFKLSGGTTSTQTYSLPEGGTGLEPITYDFGWNREDMMSKSTNVGENMTFFDFSNGGFYGIIFSSTSGPIVLSGSLGMTRISSPFRIGCSVSTSTDIIFTVDDFTMIGCDFINSAAQYASFAINNLTSIAGSGFLTSPFVRFNINNLLILSNVTSTGGGSMVTYPSTINNCTIINSDPYAALGALNGGIIIINNLYTTSSNLTAPSRIYGSEVRILSSSYNDGSGGPFFSLYGYDTSKVISYNDDGIVGNHIIQQFGATTVASSSIRHKASGYGWQTSVTNTNLRREFPAKIQVSKVAVKSGSVVTMNLWMMRNSPYLYAGTIIDHNPLVGLENDITTYMTVGSGSWEQVTSSFIPTNDGVVNVNAFAYSGSTWSMWFDDFSVT